MTYDIYIKGVAEPTYRASSYAIYDEQGNLAHEGRKETDPNRTVSDTIMSFCMELYAASCAIHQVEEGSAVRIHTNNQTISSWISKMKPRHEPYAPFWELFASNVVLKHITSISAEWHKKDTCQRLDAVRKKAFK